MAAEIAQAFVRIRPNMASFKGETEAGVTSAFAGAFRKAAALVGVAFGAEILVHGLREIVGEAASVQKQVETVRLEFGRTAQAVLDFGEKSAAALGISKGLADTTAARFGILFKNLNLGPTVAAKMTIGLEKLAGSLSMIRGVDPAEVLSKLPLVLAGNTRALKQMGISIDVTQIKLAAYKLGLISSIKDAITPAVKAQAIYALATAKLGLFQDQAQKHSNDLANVQRRLSAEWANAKEELASRLIPAIAPLVRHLERWLRRMQDSGKLQHDFNEIIKTSTRVIGLMGHAISTSWGIVKTATGWVGGLRKALEIFFAVIVVRKIFALAAAIRTELIANGFRQLQIATEAEQAAYLEAFGAMEIATIGLGATIRSALISTGIGALAVAVGFAAVEIIQHWDTVKRWLVEFGQWMSAHAKEIFFLPVIGQVLFLVIEIKKHFGDIKTVVIALAHFFGTVFTHPIRAVENLFGSLKDVASRALKGIEIIAVKAALAILKPFDISIFGHHLIPGLHGLINGLNDELGKLQIEGIGKKVADQLASDFHHRGDAIAAAVNVGKKVGTHVVDGVTDTVTHSTAKVAKAVTGLTEAALAASRARIAASIVAAKKNLDTIGQKVADTINKLLEKTNASLTGSSSPVTVAYQKLLALLRGGAGTIDISRAAAVLQGTVDNQGPAAAKNTQQILRDQFHNLTKAFSEGKKTLPQFNAEVAALLKKDHVSFKQAGKVLGSAFTDGFKDELGALHAQAKALNDVPARLRNRGAAAGDNTIRIIHPLQVIQHEQAAAARVAKAQRDRIARATEKTAKATEKAAALAAQVAKTKVNSDSNPKAKKNAEAATNRHGG